MLYLYKKKKLSFFEKKTIIFDSNLFQNFNSCLKVTRQLLLIKKLKNILKKRKNFIIVFVYSLKAMMSLKAYFQNLIDIINEQKLKENCEKIKHFFQLIASIIVVYSLFSKKIFKLFSIIKQKSNKCCQPL